MSLTSIPPVLFTSASVIIIDRGALASNPNSKFDVSFTNETKKMQTDMHRYYTKYS